MNIRILCFASTQDATGSRELTIEVPAGGRVVDCLDALRNAYPAVGPLLDRCRIALNDEFAAGDAPVGEGDTVALLPPMSGG